MNNNTIQFVPNKFLGTANINYEVHSADGILIAKGTLTIETFAPTTKPKHEKDTFKKVLFGLLIFAALLLIITRESKCD